MDEFHEEEMSGFPPEEWAKRRALGAALTKFVKEVTEATLEGDDVARRQATREFRRAVELAAEQGIEVVLAWHAVAVWTEDGRERIGFFSRALDTLDGMMPGDFTAEDSPRAHARQHWSMVNTRADCLFEIGRVHAHEGAPSVAREFLMKALPLAQKADQLRESAGIEHDDRLEGRIAELLVQLDEEE